MTDNELVERWIRMTIRRDVLSPIPPIASRLLKTAMIRFAEDKDRQGVMCSDLRIIDGELTFRRKSIFWVNNVRWVTFKWKVRITYWSLQHFIKSYWWMLKLLPRQLWSIWRL
jgi:hypothetical protein